VKVLVIDNDGEGTGVDIAYRAQGADHDVRYFLPPFQTGKARLYGDGLVEKVKEWKPSMDWAELIILTGNTILMTDLAPYFGKGYPIFGANAKGAELETDRELGQKILKDAGVKTAPFQIVSSVEEAVKLIAKTGLCYAMKGWGGDAAKHMSYVAASPEDAIFTLRRWKADGKFSGQLMLQEKIEGVEVGISGMFGPSGWNAILEESFEYKKFLNDDLGENTGEMGTVIRHTVKSKLFDEVLEPVTDYLHSINYVGDCSVNCIVDGRGIPWPLEFTMRLGWPDFCIRQSVIKNDPVDWMKALIEGKDQLRTSPDVAVGVCLAHGDFPRGGPSDSRPKDPLTAWAGYPIYGVSDRVEANIHWQQAMIGRVPMLVGDQIEDTSMICTAGNYPMVVTGTGRTIKEARDAAYEVAWGLKIPSNLMFRTDIGEGLEAQVKLLQKHGYLEGMK
jgi:phosphoribosylamine---glycine ligase